jgi:CRP/FNR family cyclic AMP-dependent transcriptional regulator
MVRARLKSNEAGSQKKHDGSVKLRPSRPLFAAQAFLDSADVHKSIVEYAPLATIFAQGDPCDGIMYIQPGAVRLSALSAAGKEAIVAMLGPGDFLGEGALAAQRVRMAAATAARQADFRGPDG